MIQQLLTGNICWGAALLNAVGGVADEALVGARALEVGQAAASSLEGWEETGLSASWDISDSSVDAVVLEKSAEGLKLIR